jgi:hypothetical protein
MAIQEMLMQMRSPGMKITTFTQSGDMLKGPVRRHPSGL